MPLARACISADQVGLTQLAQILRHVSHGTAADPCAASKSSVPHRWTALVAGVVVSFFHPASAQAQNVTFTPHTRLFVSYSVNADYVPNLPFMVIADQPRSPFFSLDAGLFGFEVSLERSIRPHVGLQVSVSGYVDPIRGHASYCQPGSCAVSVPWTDDTSALFVTAGPVFTMRETRRTSWFVHALVGVVRSRSMFTLTGSDIQYAPTPGPDTLILVNSTGFGQPATLSETDRFADVALAATLGGGFDRQMGRRLQFRMSIDWNPTFVSRPQFATNAEAKILPSDLHMQNHLRLSLGLVWRF